MVQDSRIEISDALIARHRGIIEDVFDEIISRSSAGSVIIVNDELQRVSAEYYAFNHRRSDQVRVEVVAGTNSYMFPAQETYSALLYDFV